MEIPVRAEPREIRGTIRSIELGEGEFGPVITVSIEAPASLSLKILTFGLSTSKHSRWIQFVESFNQAIGRAIASAREMVGAYVEVAAEPRQLRIRGSSQEVEYWIVRKATLPGALSQEEKAFLRKIRQESAEPSEYLQRAIQLGYTAEQAAHAMEDAPF